MELPAEKELRRIVNAALYGFFQDLYMHVSARLTLPRRAACDQLLVVGAEEAVSGFEKLKAEPATPGVDNLMKEIDKLCTLRAVGIPEEVVADVPFKVCHLFKRRGAKERAGEMRDHPEPIRMTLMACFISIRTSEVFDDITRMMMQLLHRIDAQTEQQFERELLQDIKRAAGKLQILHCVSEAVVAHPEGTVRKVIFPRIKEEVFHDLVAEFQISGPQYRWIYHTIMRNKYGRHYRRMVPLVLRHLTFRSGNRFQPVLDALALIKRYWGAKQEYSPDDIPWEGRPFQTGG